MLTPTPAGRIFTYARVSERDVKSGSCSFSRWSGSRGGPGLSDRERQATPLPLAEWLVAVARLVAPTEG